LREHPDVAREYATLKRQLAMRYNEGELSSLEAYANAKTEFIERVVQTALAAGNPTDLGAESW
jgi:GrpB-like predicted nucleotidyltransferase (UPF0157 family)